MQKAERIKYLNSEYPNDIDIQAIVVVQDQKFIEVAIEQLEEYALNWWLCTIWSLKIVKSLILTIPLRLALSFSLICVSMDI